MPHGASVTRLLLATVLALAAFAAPASARDVPGDFDFYVLALSWSPSYCASEAARRGDQIQCAGPRPYSFVVHGLWPQRERGFPERCDVPGRVPESTLRGMLDIMPSTGLAIYQWRKHGTCTGLGAVGYFERVRAARERVQVPAAFQRIEAPLWVRPDDLERAFRDANPGLRDDMIAVTCDNRMVREVRICMTRELGFRSCPEIDRRSCRLGRALMPPVRGGGGPGGYGRVGTPVDPIAPVRRP